MRRNDREITSKDKMLEILNECDCCRLGLNDNGSVYIVPLNFGWNESDGTLKMYFHCACEGRKLEIIRQNPSVSFELDRSHVLVPNETACQHTFLYQCIMGTGTAKIITDNEGKINGLISVMSHYSDKSDWSFDPKMVDRINVIELTVHSWSCKEH